MTLIRKKAAPNPLAGWQVDRASIRTIGRELQRPECILAQRDGSLWAADARGGVVHIRPDGDPAAVARFDAELDSGNIVTPRNDGRHVRQDRAMAHQCYVRWP
jgi:hypothetical protein